MDLDRIIHEKKNFAELADADIHTFLHRRAFNAEHLNLEFKREFLTRPSGKFEIQELCRYIVGFSNEEGGLVVYGVADSIKEPATPFETYVVGLASHPSTEDLSQWVKERIHPLIASPAIRLFTVDGRVVAVLKVPAGINKPYCYFDPSTRAVTYYKKTAGTIAELAPAEIGEFHRTHFIAQSADILRAAGFKADERLAPQDRFAKKIADHEAWVLGKIEDPVGYGFVGAYCYPVNEVKLRAREIEAFIQRNRLNFAEALRHHPDTDALQHGVSVGYFPRAIRSDIKSTARTTFYQDGLVAFAAQADMLMEGDHTIHVGWLCYELQRHLQTAKAFLDPHGVEYIDVEINFKNVDTFYLGYRTQQANKYAGQHDPLRQHLALSEINSFDGPDRNIVMPALMDIMDEISRVFGFSETIHGVWDEHGYLLYVRGLEYTR